MLLVHQGGRQGAGWSGGVELKSREQCSQSIFAQKGFNLKIRTFRRAVPCNMGYFEINILPTIFFMYGGILTLTHSHLYHYWHIPTMVGFCHGGNMLGNHDDSYNDNDLRWSYPRPCSDLIVSFVHFLLIILSGQGHHHHHHHSS